ncbi:MAG: ATP synthase F1 subunit delta [Pyrinomonadaceae bacterium]
MNTETIARRYSAALADVVLASGETDAVKAELTGWAEMLSGSADLQTVFSNPSIAHASKEKVLDGLLAKVKPSKATANFLKVLLQNGRLMEIGEINDRFDAVLEERSGVVSAEITSARELPENERAAFKTNLEKLTGKTVNINYAINIDIIGGVVTRIGSTVYDGSVKTKLENLKEQLVNG